MQSVMRDVTKQMLQAAITGEGAFAKLFGTNSSSGGVGGLAGLLSKAFGGGGDISGGSSANPLPGLSAEDYGIGFKPGGYTGDGSRDDPAGIVHKGEWVFDQDAVKRIGVDRLAMLQRGYANGGPVGMPSIPSINSRGSGSDITVNLIEDSSRAGQVQKKDNGNGGFNIEAYVDSITARNVGNPGSATRASLASAGRVVRR
jgi:phage-related minor tail protein